MQRVSESEINEKLAEIQADCDRLSAEARNALHACIEGHPIGQGRDRTDVFRSAAFMIRRPGCSRLHAEWLNKVANQFHSERAA